MKHLVLVAPLFALAACADATPVATPATTSTVTAPVATTAAMKESCGADTASPIQYTGEATTKDKSGATVIAVGAKLTGAPVVSVAQLLAKPEDYAGKLVRLEGNVSAMCTHGRAWFSIQDNDKSGAYVRVITRPVFMVPENAIGTKARAEGLVELKEVNPATAEHFAKEHQLAAPATPKAVIIRAAGAEFI